MSEIVRRYEKLKLREHLNQSYYYPFVCKELSFILRSAYSKLPKNLQSILFQDTLSSFRSLPIVETHHGIEAANLLVQAAEFALPKHKKILAVTEFKHAVVACKRRQRAQRHVEGSVEIPQDVLVHIFSFLDIHSLVAVGLVSWSWNSAAIDRRLWQSQYELFFGSSSSFSECKGQMGKPTEKYMSITCNKESVDLLAIDWREAFKETYIGYGCLWEEKMIQHLLIDCQLCGLFGYGFFIFSDLLDDWVIALLIGIVSLSSAGRLGDCLADWNCNSLQKFTSNRGYCSICETIVWLENMKCPNVHRGVKVVNQHMKPVLLQQVMEYLLEDSLSSDYSSDSDSDLDEGSSLKLWAYAKHL
ncbi:hypothetical protein IFM89_029859 [Coptis chinensis]|uniref:F-box domain-containing protein n=1 Tax=Coptis chinensis TaxID=261450 RepID=A0A835LPF4_9MAGN|nr:hypothetical protein IFM89_029859 [Coptis chinensis]